MPLYATLSGVLATQQKEKLENLIADQFELGIDGLDEEKVNTCCA